MNESLKLLFVDDEENVLSSIKRVFINEDIVVRSALSADEALGLIEREGPFPVVFSDYRMPGTNGVEFLQKVNRKWPQTVGIILSAYTDADVLIRGVLDGRVHKFMAKPWNDEELKAVATLALKHHVLIAENEKLRAALKEKSSKRYSPTKSSKGRKQP